MSSPLSQAGVFLIQTLFGFAIFVVLARVFLQLVRANFFNPICQFVVKVTNPILVPVKKLIPNIGRFDTAAMVLAYVLQLLENALVYGILGVSISVPVMLAFTVVTLIGTTFTFFFVVIIVQVILSWVSPYGDNPVSPVVSQLAAPIVDPIRRILPPLAGIDFSPMVAIILLHVTKILVIGYLTQLLL